MDKNKFSEIKNTLKEFSLTTEERRKEDTEGKKWDIEDSTLNHYGHTFIKLLPTEFSKLAEFGNYGYALRKYFEYLLAEKEGKAVGLDIGGVGYNFFSGFKKNFFSKTTGMALVDRRSPSYEEFTYVDKELLQKHRVIEGDMFNRSSKNQLKNWLEGKTIDLAVMRMILGRKHIPGVKEWQFKQLSELYSMMSEESVVFLQLPYNLTDIKNKQMYDRESFMDWISKIQNDYKGLLELKLQGDVFSLIRHKGSPKELPI